ncbi:transglycosylase family protein [Shewanella psychrophila]|uniref:Transglycosylase family protein n=1 Tax=Shewanella psychrophila TaxID=225848 RepID=A0A1S6HTV0_9GAMM|nr:lytic transglycosylase domain-containing protein [Shewanella psychrophila]AQS38990.1 transglycosylase family protein [Shewanella psychrophila]
MAFIFASMKKLIVLTALTSLNAHAFCFDEAGIYYHVNPKLLSAIAKVESDYQSHAININRNSKGKTISTDYGLMQINSHWFSRLSPFGVNKDNLLSDACYNVHIGAWVQSQNFSTHGYNWNSVGAYNAGFSAKTLTRRLTYIRKIKAALATLNQPNYSFPKT